MFNNYGHRLIRNAMSEHNGAKMVSVSEGRGAPRIKRREESTDRLREADEPTYPTVVPRQWKNFLPFVDSIGLKIKFYNVCESNNFNRINEGKFKKCEKRIIKLFEP